MYFNDLPPSTVVGTVPSNLDALVALLKSKFPSDPKEPPFRYVGCIKSRTSVCRFFAQQPCYGTVPLERPIPTLEALAHELLRVQKEFNYKNARCNGHVNQWEIRSGAAIEGGVCIIAFLTWI